MMNYQPLTDLQWQLLEPLFPKPVRRGRGKPHTPWRSVVNSILWVLSTGGKWDGIPKDVAFASKSASHRWYLTWVKNGFLEELLRTYKSFAEMARMIQPPRRNRGPRKEEVCVVELAMAQNLG